MFEKAFTKRVILQFSNNCIKFTWLFFLIFSVQTKDSQNQNLDSEALQKTAPTEDPHQVELDKIQKEFRTFLRKCAQTEFFDQILVHLTELFSIIDQELKDNDPLKTISTRSITAMSKISQICTLLVKNTQSDLSQDLKALYLLVSKIFGWNKEMEKSLFATYKSKRRWHILKGFKDGSFFMIISMFGTISGAIFSLFKYKKLASNTIFPIFGKSDGEKAVGEQTTFKGKTDSS